MAYKLKDRKEKMLYKGSVYELTLQWDRESLRKCFCGMPPFYAHIRKDGTTSHISTAIPPGTISVWNPCTRFLKSRNG